MIEVALAREALVAAFLALPIRVAVQPAAHLTLLPETGTVTLAMTGDSSGPGRPQHHDERVALTAIATSEYDTSVVEHGAPPQRMTLAMINGGLAQKDDAPPPAAGDARMASTLAALNTLVALTRFAPDRLAPGISWSANALAVMPSGERAVVPLTVTVRSVDGAVVTLAANGTYKTMLEIRGNHVAAQVELSAEAEFRDRRFVRGTTQRTLSAHAYFRTLHVVDRWSIGVDGADRAAIAARPVRRG